MRRDQSGALLNSRALDDAIEPTTPEQARRAALHVVTAGKDPAERVQLLDMLGLLEVLR